MVDVRMAHHHGVDRGRIDAGLRHAIHQLAGGRSEVLHLAHAGIEQDRALAHVHDQGILLEDGVVHRQEVGGELARHLILGQALEIFLGLAKRQRAVGHDGGLGIADLEAVKVGRLDAEHWAFGKGRSTGESGRERGAARENRAP